MQTKLNMPGLRPSLIPRADLIERLNAGRHGRLTLISAPAGFGKTTLAVAWLKRQQSLVAWISLDPGDDDPRRFLLYLISACRQTLPTVDADLLRLLQLPAADIVWERVLTAVLNEIAAANTPLILALDEYQHIEAAAIHEMLSFWLEHQPARCQLLLTTRRDPPLPLSRWRARGQLNEVRLDDLRFTPEEIDQFFRETITLTLSQSDLALLAERTEGWPAGLQLAAAAMPPAAGSGTFAPSQFIASFSGSNRLVLDYLADEVLAQQAEDTRHFLFCTAVSDRLCAPLCAALLAADGKKTVNVEAAQKMLELLDDANLFIMPLDQERRWYRYHPLFTDLLRDHLQRTQAEKIPILHGRASRWFAANGLPAEAINHALAAEDETAAARLIAEQAPALIRRGEVAALNRWLQQLAPAVRQANPRLDLYLVVAQLLAGAFTHLSEMMTTVDRMTAHLQTAVSPESDRLLAEANAIRAVLLVEKGDTRAGLALAEPAALELAQDSSAYGRYLQAVLAATMGLAYRDLGKTETAVSAYARAGQQFDSPAAVLLAAYEQGRLRQEMGQLRQAEQILQQALAWSTDQFGSGAAAVPLVGAAHIGLGRLLYERHRLDEAGHSLENGIELTAQRGGLGIDRDGLLALAFVRQAQGSSEEANELMARALAHASQSPRADAQLRAAAKQTRLWLLQGNLAAADQWARQQTIDLQNPAYPAEITAVTLACVQLHQQQGQHALAILDPFLPLAERGGRYGRLIEIWLLQAAAHQQLAQADKALDFLKRSLNLAAAEGYVRLFLDVGQPLRPLLETAVAQGIMPDVSHQLLALLTSEPKQPATLRPGPSASLIEPLSERELEVLRLVAEGLTNREIGLRLHLSPNTIKRHTLNIYEKLNVHNRTEAVAAARNHGFLR